jgi:hypothetical protein
MKCYFCHKQVIEEKGSVVKVKTGEYSGAFGHGSTYTRMWICNKCSDSRQLNQITGLTILLVMFCLCVIVPIIHNLR